jgi:hypothetical protein
MHQFVCVGPTAVRGAQVVAIPPPYGCTHWECQGVDIKRIGYIGALRWLCEVETDDLPELVVNPAR